MSAPRNRDASFMVRDVAGRPIGAVIVGRGPAANLYAAWSRSAKLGEHTNKADAIAAVKRAHFARKREERRK